MNTLNDNELDFKIASILFPKDFITVNNNLISIKLHGMVIHEDFSPTRNGSEILELMQNYDIGVNKDIYKNSFTVDSLKYPENKVSNTRLKRALSELMYIILKEEKE